MGVALSGCVSGAGRPWISDILYKYKRSEGSWRWDEKNEEK